MKTYLLHPLQTHVTKDITIPGSKSYTNRALFLASLTKGKVTIANPLFSEDTAAMIVCLQTLGITITVTKEEIIVLGDISDIVDAKYTLHANLSGTTLRFILALCAITPGEKTLSGKSELNKRPIAPLVTTLQKLGADISYTKNDGFPPLKITSATLIPKKITIDGSISSQYLSAILMIAPCIGPLTIRVKNRLISKPYVAMTIAIMKTFGVTVLHKNNTEFFIPKATYNATNYTVEGDYSSAGYFAAIAVLTGSTLTLKNLQKNSLQADKNFFDVLQAMGNTITFSKNSLTIKGKTVVPVQLDMNNFPDQAQTLAVLAAFAKGITKITGISSLRVKETERIQALENELKKMGIRTKSSLDSLMIYGGNPKAAKIKTYNDHRMAMSFAIAGTKLSGLTIQDPTVVNKTFPTFWNVLASIGVKGEML